MRQWTKITKIIHADHILKEEQRNNIVRTISFEKCEEIVIRAAPFVHILRLPSNSFDEQTFVVFGTYWFKVVGFNSDKTLRLFAQNATQITKVISEDSPNSDQLKLLFATNTIKKLDVYESYDFYKNVPTDGIEELLIRFTEDGMVASFEGVCIFFTFEYFFMIY